MIKKIVTITMFSTLFLNSCKETPKQENTETRKIKSVSDTKKEYFGTYEGTSPGANSLIKETLTLNSDYTFTKKTAYTDKENAVFIDKGTFKINGKKVVLNIDQGKECGFYKIYEEYLLKLDIKGSEITGETSEMYKMKKLTD